MDNPQYYQPLSHALHPLVPASHSTQQQYSSYGSHAQTSTTNGTTHREEEEEEEDDDEEIVEEELDHNDHDAQSHNNTNPSPRAPASAQTASKGAAAATANASANKQQSAANDQGHLSSADNEDGKRKPGRPRGSRNRKPRAPPGSSTKAPANSQHPGFYQYPPAPAGGLSQNQQFYEFQWRALNLCSEFYNAAEELVKAASPMVIAQCYQMGPATKIDPLAMIAEAKRVCDNLLANPSQLVGNPPPPVYSMPSYTQMPPPATAAPSASSTPASGSVITNASSFVMSLGTPGMPPPSHAPQSYYPPPMYATAPGGYPRAPYYPYPHQGTASYYPPPPQPAATPVQSSPPPATTATGTISTFNAATGSAAPGGQQGTWSEEETERLKNLAEQSRDMGGPQNKGEIEWDWVVQQWGNSRTRHQILLKATSMGLKESTTRGTKRRRETDASATDGSEQPAATSTQTPTATTAAVAQPQNQTTPHTQSAPLSSHSQSAAMSTSNSTPSNSINVSPAMPPQRPPSSSNPVTIAPSRTTTTSSPATASNMPWPMPTVAVNTPSPVLASAQVERNNYYRSRPPQTTAYGAAAGATTSTTTSYGAVPASSSTSRPSSSHESITATHQYMYRPNGAPNSGRRDGS